ncbi:MAG: hypothetical protein ABI091_06645 [Ferruginibacter sp.]
MSFKTTTCAKCGNLFTYDDSTWSKKPERDGLFGGYLCSNCTNRIETERTSENFRKQDERRLEDERMDYENNVYEERIREQNERQRRENEIQRRQEEAQYRADNPGDYECPHCFYGTLRRNATRCPKCQGVINSNYWANIQRIEAQKREKERLKEEELERTRPAREAAQRAAQQKMNSNNVLSYVLGISLGLIIWFLSIHVIFDVININRHIDHAISFPNKFSGLSFLIMWLLTFAYVILVFLLSWYIILVGWLFIPRFLIKRFREYLNNK